MKEELATYAKQELILNGERKSLVLKNHAILMTRMHEAWQYQNLRRIIADIEKDMDNTYKYISDSKLKVKLD